MIDTNPAKRPTALTVPERSLERHEWEPSGGDRPQAACPYRVRRAANRACGSTSQAIELSQGAANCTADCQAQERIRGSLPVPPDPSNPTPICG